MLGVGISYCAWGGDVVLCRLGIWYCAWARVIVLCL